MPLFPISLGCYLVSVYHPRGRGSPQGIDRAPDAPSAPVQDMGVDHGRLDVFVREQLLNGPDVVPVLQQVCREGMAEGWQVACLAIPADGGRAGERGDGAEAALPGPGGSRRRRMAPRDSVGAMGWRRGRAGRSGRTPVGVRVRFGERSRADPMGPPPSGVPGRCTGQEPTLDPARLSSHRATTKADSTDQAPFAFRPAFPSFLLSRGSRLAVTGLRCPAPTGRSPALSQRAALQARDLYTTRHTFAANALAAGEQPAWVAGVLGHTTPGW